MSRHNAGGRHINIPIFVPHMGCPNTCVFCDQRRISGTIAPVSVEDVRETIEKYLAASSGEDHAEIAFFGGSFTGIPECQMTGYLGVAREYLDMGLVDGIRISTRPDYIDHEILDILKEHGVRIIELGVQSMDDNVLARSKRGHTAEDVVRAVGQIRGFGFELGIQIMPGLPGDTLEKPWKPQEKWWVLRPARSGSTRPLCLRVQRWRKCTRMVPTRPSPLKRRWSGAQ